MKIYLDTANVEEIKKTAECRIIDGITTNPTLFKKSKNDKSEKNKYDIRKFVDELSIIDFDDPVHIEIMSNKSEQMVKEAESLSEISGHIVAKIPICEEGLKAIKLINDNDIILTNATLCFSVNQAILASKAGADFVSFFIGRMTDISNNGMQTVGEIVNIFGNFNIETNVIAASIRDPLHVIEAAKAGVRITTIPYNVLQMMIRHPLTDIGIKRFKDDFEILTK